jgi:hypothetical protein
MIKPWDTIVFQIRETYAMALAKTPNYKLKKIANKT